MQPDEASVVIADTPAEEQSLSVGHPIDNDSMQDDLARLGLAESLLETMYEHVRSNLTIASQDAITNHANEARWYCRHVVTRVRSSPDRVYGLRL
ncbi:MAG: hypothetical protein U0893_15365 [Chloroflexota bacterium]